MIINEIKNKDEFYNIIKTEDKVLIKFFSVSCAPCRKLASILEKEKLNCNIYKIDAMECFDISDKYSISAVPTILYFKNGEPIHKFYGIVGVDKIKEIVDNG